MLRAGDLNSRIEIQHRTLEQDKYGQRIERWITFAKVWADVRHISGIESIKGGIEVSEVRASVRIRYMKNVMAAMRLVIDGQVYEIESVLPDVKRKEYLDLTCKVLNNDS